MKDADKETLYEEAADLFMRLQDAPDNCKAKAELGSFLARGRDAQRAYEKVSKAWAATAKKEKSRPGNLSIVLLAAGLGLAAYFLYPSARIFFLADLRSGFQPITSELSSGDTIILDAKSAIIDDTAVGARRVEILKGVGFFDVTPDARPFAVSIGPLEVIAIGTSFETAILPSGTSVAVVEGSVEVRSSDEIWRLEAGDRLHYSDLAETTRDIANLDTIASWRSDQFVVNGMLLSDVVDIIDRRLPGETLITSRTLSRTPITAGFDLSDPEQTLELLAESLGARVIAAPLPGRLLFAR
ncbi:MAG: FecR domain-containing protein [Pseudomonadota bacterium]